MFVKFQSLKQHQPTFRTSDHESVQAISKFHFAATTEGLPGVLGNKGTLAKYRREQRNISQFWEQGNKIRKITVRKNSDIRNREHYFGVGTWEHRAILEGNKGTRTPPGRPSQLFAGLCSIFSWRISNPSVVKLSKMSLLCYTIGIKHHKTTVTNI